MDHITTTDTIATMSTLTPTPTIFFSFMIRCNRDASQTAATIGTKYA